MRMGFTGWNKAIAPVIIALSLAAPGCKSGWKMPGTSMWPWSRQPSAETLSGTAPKLETPAAKHSPAAITSSAAGLRPAATTATAPNNGGVPSTPASYSGGPTAAMNNSTYGGSAAAANGYQIGPYGMSGGTAAGSAAPANPMSGSPQVTSAGGTTGYPSGNYLPPNTYAGAAGIPSGAANNPYATPAAATGVNPQVSFASAALASPTPMTQQTATSPAGGYSMPTVAPRGASSMPTFLPPGSAPQAPGNAPGNALGQPSAYSGLPAAAGQQPPAQATPAEGYRPGTTARSTTYNFGSGATSAPVNSYQMPPASYSQSPSAYGPAASMPASAAPASATPNMPTPGLPNMGMPSNAAGGYGNFQLPPNTATSPSGMPTYR